MCSGGRRREEGVLGRGNREKGNNQGEKETDIGGREKAECCFAFFPSAAGEICLFKSHGDVALRDVASGHGGMG